MCTLVFCPLQIALWAFSFCAQSPPGELQRGELQRQREKKSVHSANEARQGREFVQGAGVEFCYIRNEGGGAVVMISRSGRCPSREMVTCTGIFKIG